ncbi:hypothetical protein NBRC116595_24630 [Aliiglaciecola sp. NS0011-25]
MLLENVYDGNEMNKEEQIIDLNFAVSQLSGNQSLLIKLLLKFNDQYQNLGQELVVLKEKNDLKAYKEVIHTVKGVSGNLGLNALHFASKKLETSVINQNDFTELEENFVNQLNATVNKINSLANDENASADTGAEQADKSSQSILIEMLENNEFITPDKLNSLLADCAISEMEKQALHNAIGDLDYEEALSVINKNS